MYVVELIRISLMDFYLKKVIVEGIPLCYRFFVTTVNRSIAQKLRPFPESYCYTF